METTNNIDNSSTQQQKPVKQKRSSVGKWLLRIILIIFGVVILLVSSVYVPFVQRFVLKNVLEQINEGGDINISVDDFSLSFPLDVQANDVLVKQNADSWGLSINGKLSGTNYTFDGNNFSIGSTTGQTNAYHAAGYSKWTHTDGSYTRIDAKGMTWNHGGQQSGYHYLLYAGEYRCPSEATWTVTLPAEFQGKDFKVVTSIKRIYISNDSYVTGCYFPLLSFYAEALNINKNAGTFQVYASVRAWNRTSYGGWGQMVGNGTTASEREAMQPVVAYWAFV